MQEGNSHHPDGLARAKALATPGCCVFCEEPLPPIKRCSECGRTNGGMARVVCGSRSCRSAYMAAWRRDRQREIDGSIARARKSR